MMMMKKSGKRSKLMKMLTSPMRIVEKAADMYKRTMDDYAPAVSNIKLPRSFSSNNHRAGAQSKYYDVFEEPESERSTRGARPRSEAEVVNRMVRIGEDSPCELEEDDEEDIGYGLGNVEDRVVYERSSGYGLRRRRSYGSVGVLALRFGGRR